MRFPKFWQIPLYLLPACFARIFSPLHARSNIILQQMDYSQRQDTQVAVEEAVAYPTSIRNANAELLKRVDMRSAIQRTHHWSPLHEEVLGRCMYLEWSQKGHIWKFETICIGYHWITLGFCKPVRKLFRMGRRGLHGQVLFLTTSGDDPLAMFDTPKDRHVFPWLEVNTRFGVIQRKDECS